MKSGNKEHDLFNFFRNANEDIEREYKRIYDRILKDPGPEIRAKKIGSKYLKCGCLHIFKLSQRGEY